MSEAKSQYNDRDNASDEEIDLREISKVVIGIENSHQLKIHLETAKKNLETDIVDEALSIKCKNEKILNPTLWP